MDSEFRDTLGASVNSDGSHKYSVFVAASGKRSIVIVNEEFSKKITAMMQLPNAGKLVVATPEQPNAIPVSGNLEIPARSAIVVIEQ